MHQRFKRNYNISRNKYYQFCSRNKKIKSFLVRKPCLVKRNPSLSLSPKERDFHAFSHTLLYFDQHALTHHERSARELPLFTSWDGGRLIAVQATTLSVTGPGTFLRAGWRVTRDSDGGSVVLREETSSRSFQRTYIWSKV